MTTSPEKDQEKAAINKADKDKPSCFVIMPIADMQGYESRHFDRVYNHIIKPSCNLAGFNPIRADDVTSSNFIVLDILRKIIECDIAICDLSGRNPNVMYELGLRQAFNKKTVLIKDEKTTSPFDVQAFRYFEYDSSLRIDNAQLNVQSISSALNSTYGADSNDINSIVQLLRIQPAQVGEKTVLSQENSLLFKAIKELEQKLNPPKQSMNNVNSSLISVDDAKRYSNIGESLKDQLDFYPIESLIGNLYYDTLENKNIGTLQGLILDKNGKEHLQFKLGRTLSKVSINSPYLSKIIEDDIPF
ncbi:hypothetical protein [Kosakonia sp.]|uniref:hypothetical protein n=1 Tax=Kosakonia sp. TaxID=1916651 RepID=UPI0028B17341|nr:hypothetical protein [Kosakonia sp.]